MTTVSIIVPCLNEEKTIPLLLQAIWEQTYPRQELEVIVADGMSTDGTRAAIEQFRLQHPDLRIRVVDNLPRTIPAGLNRALAAATGEVIVRLDAHSVPRPDYVARCVALLEAGQGDNVGGVWDIRPGGVGWLAEAIAAAASSPLAVGDARYRYSTAAQLVDTVPFGAYRRSLVERIGGYDESLLTNEDYEFNVRVRQAGGKIWLDPSIRSTYFARPNLRELARQYWRYGYWKTRMLRRYPATIRWRQLTAPTLVLSLLLLGLTGLFWRPAAWLFVIELCVYLGFLALSGLILAVKQRRATLFFGVPLAIAVMHFSWGSAFLWSWLRK